MELGELGQSEERHGSRRVEERYVRYAIGGPVGKPGGTNKLFFFYSHEYRPTTSGGDARRFRLPTELELVGDFSRSTNNNGDPINQLYNAASGLPKTQCTGTVLAPQQSAACFSNNRIPGAPYTVPGGISLLNYWKNAVGVAPNISQDRVIAERLNYNYETTNPVVKNLTQQPAIRLDYQVSSNLRLTGKYAGQRQRVQVTPGSMVGFNDTFQKFPFIHNYSTTVNYSLNATSFLEGTWGMVVNYLGAPPVSPFSNRYNSGLGNFPLLFSDAGAIDPRYYETGVLTAVNAPFFDAATNMMNLPPLMTFGNLVSNAPPNIGFPEFLNINRTNDVSISFTKVQGGHTFKAGFYLNHSYKAQNRGSARPARNRPSRASSTSARTATTRSIPDSATRMPTSASSASTCSRRASSKAAFCTTTSTGTCRTTGASTAG